MRRAIAGISPASRTTYAFRIPRRDSARFIKGRMLNSLTADSEPIGLLCKLTPVHGIFFQPPFIFFRAGFNNAASPLTLDLLSL